MIYIWILIVLLFSAFFSASEIAFVSADRLRIELEKSHDHWYSNIQANFYKNPGQFITTMLVGNNIALVVFGLLMARLLEPYIRIFIPNEFVVVLIQTIISTILILIFAEFMPKAVSKINPNLWLRSMGLPLFLVYYILYPIASFSSWISTCILKIMKVKNLNVAAERLGKVDLDNYIEVNAQGANGPALSTEVKILQNALDFAEVKVRDCLVPRNEITACPITTSKEDLIQLFDKTGYSKILIYKETIDDIVGYIHGIEMFNCGEQWQDKIKTTVYVPETQTADKLMRLLMQKKKSIAIVVDEFGGTAGIVTLEDLVEEIFGEIEDEHDINSLVMKQISDHSYLLSGRAEIDEINNTFDLDLPSDEEFKTIAGMILSFYQGFPDRGQIIDIPPHLHFKIIRATNNRINLVEMTIDE